MKSLLATILSVPCVAANAGGYVGPFTSFAGDKKCTSVPAGSSHIKVEGTATNFALDYSCDSLQVPRSIDHWKSPMCTEMTRPSSSIYLSIDLSIYLSIYLTSQPSSIAPGALGVAEAPGD